MSTKDNIQDNDNASLHSRKRKNRNLFMGFLAVSFAVYLVIYFYTQREVDDFKTFSTILISILVCNLGATITAVSVFSVFDNRKDEKSNKMVPTLLTNKNKIYFIDAIMLSISNLLFGLLFAKAEKSTLFFIVVASCYHTYIIFHYYLHERFGTGRKSREELSKSIIKRFGKIFLSFAVPVVVFTTTICIYGFETSFNNQPIGKVTWMYSLQIVYLIICFLIKEFFLERHKEEKSENRKSGNLTLTNSVIMNFNASNMTVSNVINNIKSEKNEIKEKIKKIKSQIESLKYEQGKNDGTLSDIYQSKIVQKETEQRVLEKQKEEKEKLINEFEKYKKNKTLIKILLEEMTQNDSYESKLLLYRNLLKNEITDVEKR